jgi:hypothetical protein
MAVNTIFFENKNNNRWITFANKTIAPLWYTVKQWSNVALITTGVLWASVQFNTQHGVFPLFVAVPISVGVTWTYLSGLAFATAIVKGGWRSHLMISIGALTEALFGILYVASRYDLIPEKPNAELAFYLVLAHIIPLILLLVIYTYCKRAYLTELYTTQQIERDIDAKENDRKQRIADDKEDYERRVREAKLALVLRREEIKLSELDNNVKDKNIKTCTNCGTMLTQAQYMAMKRYGTCSQCKK